MELKKIIIQEGKNVFSVYVCEIPYTKETIVQNGAKYEEWIKMEYINN
jgi:hypothetical protein